MFRLVFGLAAEFAFRCGVQAEEIVIAAACRNNRHVLMAAIRPRDTLDVPRE